LHLKGKNQRKKKKIDKKLAPTAKDKLSLVDEEAKERRRRERVLEHFTASQCLFCGDIMINSVQEPFIGPEEGEEVASWRIKQTALF